MLFDGSHGTEFSCYVHRGFYPRASACMGSVSAGEPRVRCSERRNGLQRVRSIRGEEWQQVDPKAEGKPVARVDMNREHKPSLTDGQMQRRCL
jgi:hypothetical protein